MLLLKYQELPQPSIFSALYLLVSLPFFIVLSVLVIRVRIREQLMPCTGETRNLRQCLKTLVVNQFLPDMTALVHA